MTQKWILCPVCGSKTRDRLREDTVLMQGYSTREIAHSLNITEKAVYRRMDRLKEKIKKVF